MAGQLDVRAGAAAEEAGGHGLTPAAPAAAGDGSGNPAAGPETGAGAAGSAAASSLAAGGSGPAEEGVSSAGGAPPAAGASPGLSPAFGSPEAVPVPEPEPASADGTGTSGRAADGKGSAGGTARRTGVKKRSRAVAPGASGAVDDAELPATHATHASPVAGPAEEGVSPAGGVSPAPPAPSASSAPLSPAPASSPAGSSPASAGRSAMDGLTPRQERFVQEYLVDLNASAAVRRAGYGARVPSRTAARLMAHPGVRAAIAEAKTLRAERLQIDAGRVVLELARIAFSDPRELMEWGPDGLRLRPSSEVSRAAAASVAEVHEVKGSVQIKTLDKFKALELLGRHLGMFTADKADAEDNLDVASLLAEARERMTTLR